MADGPAGIRLQQHYEVDRATDTVYGIGVLGALENGFLVDREEHEVADQYYQVLHCIPGRNCNGSDLEQRSDAEIWRSGCA